MTSPLSPSDLAVLYRFSVSLAGVNEEAEHIVHEVLDEHSGRQGGGATDIVPLLKAIWELRPEPRGDAPTSNLPPQFQWMKIQERAVATLRGFGRFTEPEIARICGVTEWDNPAAQEKITSLLDSISVSPELLNRFAVTVQRAHPPFRFSSALGLSLIFAALVSIAAATWVCLEWKSKVDDIFAGKFVSAAVSAVPSDFHSIEAPVGELADVLFLKHGLENYPLPADFSHQVAYGVGVNQIDGHPVVHIRLRGSDARLLLFQAADFGLDADSDWQTAELDGRSLALRTRNQQGQVVILKGSPKELRDLLPK